MKIKKTKSFVAPLLVVLLSSLIAYILPKSFAATTTMFLYMGVNSSCVSTINGAPGQTYLDVLQGNDATLNVNNNDTVVAQNITGSGVAAGTQVLANTKTSYNSVTLTLSSITAPTIVTFTPVPVNNPNPAVWVDNCPLGSTPTTSSILINPAGATLACALQGSNWNLTGTFSGSSAGTALFEGTSQVAPVAGAGSFSQSVAASGNDQYFYVYDGLNTGRKETLLATVLCPKYSGTVSAHTPTPSPTPTNSTTNTNASSAAQPSNTSSSTNSPSSATTNSTSATANNSSDSTQPVIETPKAKFLSSKQDKYVATGLSIGIIVFAVAWLLNFFGILKLKTLWRSLHRSTKK